jgi:peptidoglycan/xylan/chitin deacetylase (PgdA/CDA1 family)
MSLRKNVKSGFYQVQRHIGRWISSRSPDTRRSAIAVFVLHSISPARSDMAISAARLREQMQALLEAGYRPFPIDELLAALSKSTAVPQPSFAVTFDDGYRTVVTDALPVLEELRIPATVFLTTGFLDGTIAPPWKSTDAILIREYKDQPQFQAMTWDEARLLAKHPLIRIGSHTHNHPLLGTLDSTEARKELASSKTIIRDKLGIDTAFFAYPYGVRRYGAYSDMTESLVREVGYTCSMTSEITRARLGNGRWKVPRISLTQDDEGADAVAKASGGYDWVGVAQSCYQSIFSNPHLALK